MESFLFDLVETSDKLSEQFKSIVAGSSLLKGEFRSTSLAQVDSDFTLVPSPLYQEARADEVFAFNFPSIAERNITADQVDDLDVRNLYNLSASLSATSKALFPGIKILHAQSSLLSRLALLNKSQSGPRVFLHFRKPWFDMIVMDGKKLMLCNAFPYQAPEDVAYYVLYTLEQLELSPENAALSLLGDLHMDSETYRILETYVKNIAFFEDSSGLKVATKLDSVPRHVYFNLLNQFLCV